MTSPLNVKFELILNQCKNQLHHFGNNIFTPSQLSRLSLVGYCLTLTIKMPWSRCQRACLLLWQPEFESRCSLHFSIPKCCLKRTKTNKKRPGLAPTLKKLYACLFLLGTNDFIFQPSLLPSCLDHAQAVGILRGRPLWAARRMPWSACSCFGGVGLHSTRAARSGSPETSGGWLPGY